MNEQTSWIGKRMNVCAFYFVWFFLSLFLLFLSLSSALAFLFYGRVNSRHLRTHTRTHTDTHSICANYFIQFVVFVRRNGRRRKTYKQTATTIQHLYFTHGEHTHTRNMFHSYIILRAFIQSFHETANSSHTHTKKGAKRTKMFWTIDLIN